MARYESYLKEFQALQATLVFVAGQKKEGIMGAGGYFEKHALSTPFLLDQRREVIKAYGVYKPFGLDGINVAHPSTFVIDAAGKVRWAYVGKNQFDRPDPEEVLKQVAAVGGGQAAVPAIR